MGSTVRCPSVDRVILAPPVRAANGYYENVSSGYTWFSFSTNSGSAVCGACG